MSNRPVVIARPDHTISRKFIDQDALWVMRKLRAKGHTAYLVGGAVRDILLGNQPKDFDIASDARPSQVRAIFRNCRLIGRRFRICHLFFRRKGQPEKIVELSTFRGNEPHPNPDLLHRDDRDLTGLAFGTPEEDAWRRDFTVNSLFYDSGDFSIVDYTGGLKDLKSGVIRLIGEPDDRYLEDPVRMLRALEFAARLDFEIEEKTWDGIVVHADLLADASPARLREELKHMQQKGIMAKVLEQADRTGLLAPLFAKLERLGAALPLLAYLDAKGKDGDPQHESLYFAALAMPKVVGKLPLDGSHSLDEATRCVSPAVDELCRPYQISAHIRHMAKEILISFYRLARGKSYRAKGKFMRREEFHIAWPIFELISESRPEMAAAVGFWRSYIEEFGKEPPAKKRRSRSRRRRPNPTAKAAQQS